MCGIVCFFGQAEGVQRVLEALHLLEYRAPDSAGVAALTGVDGHLSARRAVGFTRHLVRTMASNPLYQTKITDPQAILALLTRQGIADTPTALRDCSPAAGYTLNDLYNHVGLQVGIGDRGGLGTSQPEDMECTFSARMCRTLEATGALSSPDYDQDAVRHAFRLVSAHIASRAGYDQACREVLDQALLARVSGRAYTGWLEAWEEEVAANIPGHAFAAAVRYFQETFPGLAEYLAEAEWERVGGLTARAMAQVVLGHGRWAMVGAVTEANAHPIVDRSQTRAVCENGSHNAAEMLRLRTEQAAWWWAHGVAEDESVHRTENTTEVISYEWERTYLQLQNGELDGTEKQMLAQLADWKIDSPHEQALRLALRRLGLGHTHACAFYSRFEPGVLYVSSYRKPIAIVTRTIELGENLPPRYELMIASDVNAALTLWPGAEVDRAAARISELEKILARQDSDPDLARQELDSLLRRFSGTVIFLDDNLYQGEQLLARISNRIKEGQVVPEIEVSRFDGTPVATMPEPIRLNPTMVGRRGYDTYTESHIAEIPDVVDDLIRSYIPQDQVQLNSVWQEGVLVAPGLNVDRLSQHFGPDLGQLRRLLLIGEGSSWRDAQAAAPLFRELLPGVVTIIYRPVELLNIGKSVDPAGDLAIEISWSGTTDSLLKIDSLLAELGVMRLSITGRPQSDLGRWTATSAGTVDVHSGVEMSVATVKGYEAILTTLCLLALQLAPRRGSAVSPEILTQLTDELKWIIPSHIRMVIEDEERRQRIRQVARRCRNFNKIAVVGGSPVDLEGELKIEELGQVVANTFEFHSASLRPLIERSAVVPDDRQRTLFIINVTGQAEQREARAIIDYLRVLEVFCIIHTTPNPDVETWQAIPTVEVFVSPYLSVLLQPLIDVLFFFDLAVAIAYARGLSPEEIDRPRNLAKSVTTTAAERRADIEIRPEFNNVTLANFDSGRLAQTAWDSVRGRPSRAALQATVAMRAALAHVTEPLPPGLAIGPDKHLIILTDSEATENAAQMAAVAWQRLLGIDFAVYRRFINDPPDIAGDTALFRFIRAGALLHIVDPHTIALPIDMSPLQLELLASVYLMSLGVRLARQRGVDTTQWEAGLAQLPLVIDQILSDSELVQNIAAVLSPYITIGYDKLQIIGGGQDFASARSIARSFRSWGFMAEALYTDSAWHGPLATVGGPDADHDTLIIILATDPLFQSAALVDTQVYRTRHASVMLVVPEGSQDSLTVRGVDPSAVLTVPSVPRPFVPLPNVALGAVLAQEMARLWEEKIFESQ